MRKEPMCPYCGTEMELRDMDDHFPMIPEYWYRCPNCRSTSPVVQFIPDAAYDAAQRRNETPVKPLTFLGVPACYGCIETSVLRSGACLQCDYKKSCAEYSKELKRSWNELLRLGTRRKIP